MQEAAPRSSPVTPRTASLFVSPHTRTSNPLESRQAADAGPAVGLGQFIYLFFFHTRGKHNNFKGAMASQRRSQEGPAARSWRAVSLTLIRSDTRVSPKPPHCVPQMYINISMHWHNMDPLFQALLRTRCCAGAAAAFEASERQ